MGVSCHIFAALIIASLTAVGRLRVHILVITYGYHGSKRVLNIIRQFEWLVCAEETVNAYNVKVGSIQNGDQLGLKPEDE